MIYTYIKVRFIIVPRAMLWDECVYLSRESCRLTAIYVVTIRKLSERTRQLSYIMTSITRPQKVISNDLSVILCIQLVDLQKAHRSIGLPYNTFQECIAMCRDLCKFGKILGEACTGSQHRGKGMVRWVPEGVVSSQRAITVIRRVILFWKFDTLIKELHTSQTECGNKQ